MAQSLGETTGISRVLSGERISAGSASPRWSVRMADSVMARNPVLSERWNYIYGFVLRGIERVWLQTGDSRYFDYLKDNVDLFVEASGAIRTYTIAEYNLDQINPGKVLFGLYRATGDVRYWIAATQLREQLRGQPRTVEGGFWHKRIYPFQMWLDGIYMQAPFLAAYTARTGDPSAFDDIAEQILNTERHTRDGKTGLLYHGWDESRRQPWADPVTGCSPHFWGRAIGWYVMAIVDVLDELPADHPRRGEIASVLESTIAAVVRVQDERTGLWWQVLDRGAQPGNYLEASASCMFVYAIARGTRKGYLGGRYRDAARRSFSGVVGELVALGSDGLLDLHQVCASAGLGGIPYRDGSYEYYVSERIETNNYHGIGAFILAACEMEQLEEDRHAG